MSDNHNSMLAPAIPSRRAFLRRASLAAASLAAPAGLFSQSAPDYRLEISAIEWELSPKKKIRTTAFNSRIPGPLLRLTEGKPASIEILNRLDRPEIVHWHGQWIPVPADGAMEEGSPMIPPSGRTLISFTPRPSGLHWYHTHAMANRALDRGLYTGLFGPLFVDPASSPARYDAEHFLVLHDWEPYYVPSDDGSLMVSYVCASINGRMLGHDAPIPVRPGQRVLFHIVNASATAAHWLTLPGHRFQVLALDGAPVPTPALVQSLRLGPAERISALVVMDNPGIWILGEPRSSFRAAGLGTVVEYANRTGKPQFTPPAALAWDYRAFADPVPAVYSPSLTIPMVFTARFKGHGALDQWSINGRSWPDAPPIPLHPGLRHRLVFDNRSLDDHPVHLHRHNFELVSIRGSALSGLRKDVVIVEAGTKVEADLLANNPGDTLFHCHQQDHMDSGFMALFRYA
jgi:FtsP/CotA-like multicopper oxidase with cupredoxin domain